MTINEFIKQANKYQFRVEKVGDFFNIYMKWVSSDNYCFVSLDPSRKDLVVALSWTALLDSDYVQASMDNVYELLRLINALKETPIKERFPDKKYRLYVLRNSVGIIPEKCYLSRYVRDAGIDDFSYVSEADKKIANVYSETEIFNMKEYSPLIDAFEKEEVKDDE